MNPGESDSKEFKVALLSLKIPMVKSDGYVRYTIAFGYSGGGMQADIQSKHILLPESKNCYLFIGAGDEWNNVYMKNKKKNGRKYMTVRLPILSHPVLMKMKMEEFMKNLARNSNLI